MGTLPPTASQDGDPQDGDPAVQLLRGLIPAPLWGDKTGTSTATEIISNIKQAAKPSAAKWLHSGSSSGVTSQTALPTHLHLPALHKVLS